MQSGLPLEHTFRLFKQVLGWTVPKIRDPEAADRWTWLIITAHAQLRLARPLAGDHSRHSQMRSNSTARNGTFIGVQCFAGSAVGG